MKRATVVFSQIAFINRFLDISSLRMCRKCFSLFDPTEHESYHDDGLCPECQGKQVTKNSLTQYEFALLFHPNETSDEFWSHESR